MNYCFILWFAVRATHRCTILPVVRPHQSATQFYIKFSRINEKKEENSHKAKLYRTSAGEKKVRQAQDKAKSSGNIVEKSFIYK